MNREFSEQVLVLQVGKFREADLWVRFLSPTRGLLSAFAFGGSRSRRRFVGCLDIFNEISVRVSRSGRTSYLALQEGVLLKGVTRLRRDWRRFGLAVNCVRFLQSFGVGSEGAKESHFLMSRTLRLLEEAEKIPNPLPLLFRARLAFDQGYALAVDCCPRCGALFSAESSWLFLNEGQVLCRRCASLAGGLRLPLGRESLAALHFVRHRSPDEWDKLVLSPLGAKEFARAVDGFIQYHVGIAWDKGRFVRS